MTKLKHLRNLLKNRKIHFYSCIFLIMGNSVIMGSALSGVLPGMSTLFTSSGKVGVNTSGYFRKALFLNDQHIPAADYRQLISIGISS